MQGRQLGDIPPLEKNVVASFARLAGALAARQAPLSSIFTPQKTVAGHERRLRQIARTLFDFRRERKENIFLRTCAKRFALFFAVRLGCQGLRPTNTPAAVITKICEVCEMPEPETLMPACSTCEVVTGMPSAFSSPA
jgi:hypothetical protein